MVCTYERLRERERGREVGRERAPPHAPTVAPSGPSSASPVPLSVNETFIGCVHMRD